VHNPVGFQQDLIDADLRHGSGARPARADNANLQFQVSPEETRRAEAWRDSIAESMWTDYVARRERRERPEDIIGVVI
jgi:hypothetical protein